MEKLEEETMRGLVFTYGPEWKARMVDEDGTWLYGLPLLWAHVCGRCFRCGGCVKECGGARSCSVVLPPLPPRRGVGRPRNACDICRRDPRNVRCLQDGQCAARAEARAET
mmetsp:Transcript_32110/g.63682  ORF Transcript_32110/g.63682 Transcript_32110/m.63682 type:complete len:111 (-) Transcript_32110:41-373(-)